FSHDRKIQKSIQITGSKSETNRALLLQALFPTIQIENLSNSDDGELMQKGVKQAKGTVDIHHAGTAMRFLTAYFASSPGKEVVLTGSGRMQERPVQILVDALRELGADIEYMKEQGNPPLKIRGRKLTGSKVSLPAGISSQYISALLLIAPALEHGLKLELVGKITTAPYIKMTLGLLDQIGIETSFEGNKIKASPKLEVGEQRLVEEPDWSSASYNYRIVARCQAGAPIAMSSYRRDSLQGDSVLAEIYRDFGVDSHFSGKQILLEKTARPLPETVAYDLSNAPDIAQTLAVSF